MSHYPTKTRFHPNVNLQNNVSGYQVELEVIKQKTRLDPFLFLFFPVPMLLFGSEHLFIKQSRRGWSSYRTEARTSHLQAAREERDTIPGGHKAIFTTSYKIRKAWVFLVCYTADDTKNGCVADWGFFLKDGLITLKYSFTLCFILILHGRIPPFICNLILYFGPV